MPTKPNKIQFADADDATEHLLADVVSWGSTPEGNQFKLPGSIYICGFTKQISTSKEVTRIIEKLQKHHPNPIDIGLEIAPDTEYILRWHLGHIPDDQAKTTHFPCELRHWDAIRDDMAQSLMRRYLEESMAN